MQPIYLVSSSASHPSGIQQYVRQLLAAYAMKNIPVTVITPRLPLPHLFHFLGNIFSIDMETVFNHLPWYIPELKHLPQNSKVHFTHQCQALPLLYSRRLRKLAVVTVHDLIPLVYPQGESFLQRLLYRLSFTALRKSSHLIADSEHTKKDIVQYLHYPPEQISVIPLGVDLSKRNNKRTYARKTATILYVGSEMPRKNLLILFKAFARVRKKVPEVKLIKIGIPQWPGAREQLIALASSLQILDAVTFLDEVKDVRVYYKQATVCVLPSLYEGFGLPVLEAMASGCPVICSNRTSLPEVGGDAALYFDPNDEKKLTDVLLKILQSCKLQKQLQKKGFEQVKKFTWEKTAQATLAAYSFQP